MTRYAVLGPGGVGGLLAIVLPSQGHDVVVLARPETATALRDSGFRLASPLFGERTESLDVATVLDRPVDAVFVTPKATALTNSLDLLPLDAVGDAIVVPFLNGVDHLALLRERYRNVVAGVIRVESTKVAPGVIEHASAFARIELAATGELAGPAGRVVDDLRAAGFDATLRDDENAMMWSKLTFLGPIALLTTRYQAPIGIIRDEHGDELRKVIEEFAAVSGAEGGPGDATAMAAVVETLTPEMKSSMQRDAEAGRPLELDAIGGAVLRAAQRHGIPVPTTTRLVDELSARR